MRARGRRWVVLVLACAVGGYAAALLVYNPLTLSLFGGGGAAEDSVPLADFGSFYASGLAARQGLDPYNVYPLTMDASLGRGGGAAINLNAPTSVILFEFVSALDPVSARRAWFIATFVAYALMLGLLLWRYPSVRSPLAVAWALLLTGFIETVLLGQVYVFLASLSTVAWVLMEPDAAASASLRSLPESRAGHAEEMAASAGGSARSGVEPGTGRGRELCGRGGAGARARVTSPWRWLVAGALIGIVVAFKPNFIVWPGLLLLAGYWRVALASVVAIAGFGAIPLVRYGPRVYAEWLSALRLEQVNTQVANASLAGLLVRDGAAPVVGLAAGVVLLIGVGIWVWRRRPSFGATSGLALVGLLLGSPLAWVGYSVFLLPMVARGRMNLALLVACCLLCLPRLVLQGWADESVWLSLSLGAAYSVAWLILLVQATRDGS